MLHVDASQRSGSNTIANNDLVIVYERFDSLKAVRVNSRVEFSNRYGHFRMQEWVGKSYGSKAVAKPPSSGWVYLLRPTPELWTRVLLHRTQILYAADISLICTFLELRPGSTVLECGTGSGSLTHALARAVAPTGRAHTFEFHDQRATAAAQEFEDHGLNHLVSVTQRDIELLGFPDTLHGQADAVFLDVPGPWKAVASAAKCLKPNGGLATFSPCIEQVQRTRGAMAAARFWDVRVFECLLREHEVRREKFVADLDAGPVSDGSVAAGGSRKRKHGADAAAHGSAGQLPEGAIQSCIVSRPVMEARGHTGYLVFARNAVGDSSLDTGELEESTEADLTEALAVERQIDTTVVDKG